MASIVLPPTSTPANPSEGEVYYDSTADQLKVYNNSEFKQLAEQSAKNINPHIITKTLYPSYVASGTSNKLLDGTTAHSGAFGTEQTDGRMYYYTNIAGSKPIKDPRIGAHFGSQRHKFKSLQLLEQETATHGENVHSVDGREWMKVVKFEAVQNSDYGNYINHATGSSGFMEITGYFNAVNLILGIYTSRETITPSINGTAGSAQELAQGIASPLRGRYVDYGSVSNVTLPSTTLGINTIKLQNNTAGSNYGTDWFGVELIAQDTTSTTTKSQIQVPAQDVVSYGRKFSLSASATHYDPFNGWTSGNAASLATKVDTASSLGLAKWLNSTTYYRPYNGMRVVKWVDELGAIKTSVTAMPPNAKSIGNADDLTNGEAKADASVANDTFYPTFEAHTTSVNEDQFHEVAKTFSVFEYGNGQANGNTSYRDMTGRGASGTTGFQNIAYVMDDGLTSMSAQNVAEWNVAAGNVYSQAEKPFFYTFIGTGISVESAHPAGTVHNIAQNLPYGTHILKIDSTSGHSTTVITLDGVQLNSSTTYLTYAAHGKLTFHQPKRPPIPEDAVVLADYMQFADFKPQTTAGTQLISKGVRHNQISRDVFFDETDGDSLSLDMDVANSDGFSIRLSGNCDSDTSMQMRIPSFGTNYVHRGYQSDLRVKLFIDTTDNDSSATKDNTASYGSYAHLTSDLTLGVYKFGANGASGQNGYTTGFDVATPIHTSSHYQTFETPFLHELVGGDRNMEQNNLIVTSDGKTWDEVTRDTSYIGNALVSTTTNTAFAASNAVIFDDWRGNNTANSATYDLYNKDFAIAYDRLICLKDGTYTISAYTIEDAVGQVLALKLNGTASSNLLHASYHQDAGSVFEGHSYSMTVRLKRGDYLIQEGGWHADTDYSRFEITKG